MTVEELLLLIQMLCEKHPDIKGFKTVGSESQHDDNSTIYPMVRVVFPFSLIPADDESITAKIKISIRCRDSEITIGNDKFDINLNFSTENATINEINGNIAIENALRNKSARLAVHLVEWIKLSEENYPCFKVKSALIKSVERADADYVHGANIFLDLHLGNPYICEARALYESIFIYE